MSIRLLKDTVKCRSTGGTGPQNVLKPAEIIMPGVISPSVKNNVTGNENEGIQAEMDQMLMRSKEREGLNINLDSYRCLGIITELRFRLKKKKKIMYLM